MGNEDKLQALQRIRSIEVHRGLAHVDDIMACAIAYALGVPHDAPIERRDPTREELADPAVLVLDVGGVCDPDRMDFDHHQRGRDEPPKCAYKLLAEWFGVDGELAMLFPWYSVWNQIDVLGPFAVARSMGTTWAAIEGLVENPLADFLIRRFADDPGNRAKTVIALANGINLTRRCWKRLSATAVSKTVCGLPAVDFTACSTDEISRCSDAWIRLHHPVCIISKDNRGAGLTLLRCNDDPRVDFSRCKGKPYAAFAHPGGFLLKTKTMADDPEVAIRDAMTSREGDV